jgi:hypothetical protein
MLGAKPKFRILPFLAVTVFGGQNANEGNEIAGRLSLRDCFARLIP